MAILKDYRAAQCSKVGKKYSCDLIPKHEESQKVKRIPPVKKVDVGKCDVLMFGNHMVINPKYGTDAKISLSGKTLNIACGKGSTSTRKTNSKRRTGRKTKSKGKRKPTAYNKCIGREMKRMGGTGQKNMMSMAARRCKK